MLKKNQGFSLIQLLAAGVILAFGVLGLVNLQLGNQKQILISYEQTQLGFYAQDIQARLDANICNINPHSFEDSTELNEFINGDLKTLTTKLISEWKADIGTGITASLSSVFEPINGKNSSKDILEARRSWEFELKLNSDKFPLVSQQKLIVEFLKDGCL